MTFLSRPPNSPRCPPRRRAGFTILEVALAASVMAFALSGSIIVMQSGFKALDNARNTTIASQIIQSEMERIRLLPWLPTASTDAEKAISTLPASTEIDLDSIFPPGSSTSIFSDRFTIIRTSSDVADRANEMKEIRITVTWKGIDGQQHTRSTFTQYSKNGLYDYYYTKAGS